MEASCAVCDLSSPHLRVCSQCHFIYYCSKYHQRNHWRLHESQCSDLRELHYLRCHTSEDEITDDNFVFVFLKSDRVYKRIYDRVIMCLTHHYHLVSNFLSDLQIDAYDITPRVATPPLASVASSDTSLPFSESNDPRYIPNHSPTEILFEDKTYDDIVFCYSPDMASAVSGNIEHRSPIDDIASTVTGSYSHVSSLYVSRASQTERTDSFSRSDGTCCTLDFLSSSHEKSTQTCCCSTMPCDGTRRSEYDDTSSPRLLTRVTDIVDENSNHEEMEEDEWEEDDSDYDEDSLCSEDPTYFLLNSSARHFASKYRVDWNDMLLQCSYLRYLSNRLLSHGYGIHDDDLFHTIVGMNNFSNIHTITSLLNSHRIVDAECFLSTLNPVVSADVSCDLSAVKYGVCLQMLRSVFYDIHGDIEQAQSSLRHAFLSVPASCVSANFGMILLNLFVLVGRLRDYSPSISKSRVALERAKNVVSLLHGLQNEFASNEAINILVSCAECTLGHVYLERRDFKNAKDQYSRAQTHAMRLFGYTFVVFHPQHCLYIDIIISHIWICLERNDVRNAISMFNDLTERFAESLGVYHAASPLYGLVDRVKFTYQVLRAHACVDG